jgi:hypothetical protein
MEFKNGRLVLPHGVNYQLIVLPERADIPLPVLEKLEKLVLNGATLLGPKPSRDVTLTDYPKRDEQLQVIADRLWSKDHKAEHSYGKGRVISDRKRVREILQQQGVGPDFSYSSENHSADLDYIHRRTAGTDIYFVTNTKMEDAVAECVFRVSSTQAQLWHADTAGIQDYQGAEKVPGGVKLKLRLPPAGSVFVVFGSNAEANMPAANAAVETKVAQKVEIKGPWQVTFPPDRGAPPSHVFDSLVSWTDVPEDGIKHFSGTATYQKEFAAPASLLESGGRIELDLGRVRNVAEVELNGQPLGILWKPPFRCDLTAAIRPGNNTLSVKITNLWNNRLAGDQKLPKEKRVTRITQRADFNKLLESGLLGPVELRAVR